jgi:lysophospholipase L1-like esterase
MKPTGMFLILLSCLLCLQCKEQQHPRPTVFLVGDSTVKNGRGDGGGGLWGWGDFLGQFLDTTKITVRNHAMGGTSSRTFQDKGLWQPVYDSLQKGDFVLIQFGHNDDGPINDNFRARGSIKGIGEETEEIDNILTGKHEVVHTYGWYIRKLIADARSKGAIPIVCSPIPRNVWENGKVPRNDTSYGLWAKQLAEQEGVRFLDLNDRMAQELEKLGEDKVTGTYFYERDHTHTTAKGAVLAAATIVGELQKTDSPLNVYLLKDPKITLPKKRNILLVGDSTMANNGSEDAVGWGVAFPDYVDTTRVTVINRARGGRSSRTFYHEGLWEFVRKELTVGDFVLLQFGHNDAGNVDTAKFRGSLPGIGDETQQVVRNDSITETVHTYGWYMKKFIKETKEKGAIPIVLGQTPRNEWPDGKVERRDSTYGKWAKTVAEREQTFYLDITDSIAVRYETLGKEAVKAFFPKDHTHTGMDGADFNAKVVAETLKNLREGGLRDYILLPQE